ncbi:uncharacterized protein TNIN_321021 [Trichonephila inaurata madagascariensis]|uniref:Uncharacterized protein n=1 Tax=Trichonephila inaurata madagascariensis TaxID=2747483 RepID=A0A8X6YHG7_9ARAC|nr:uncharacterized protein TNIN_321021 [Trichonephila inaurata madagascariensis]
MLYQRKNLKALILFLNSHPDLFGKHISRNVANLVNLVIFIYILLPILASFLSSYLSGEDDLVTLWALRYQIKNAQYRKAVMCFGEYVYYTVITQYPSLLILSICVLIYHYGLVLLQYNADLKTMVMTVTSTDYSRIINLYNIIEEKIRLLKDTLSIPLFVILMSCFFNLYTSLSLIRLAKNPVSSQIELAITCLTGVVMIFSLTLCSSRIPEYMQEIKWTFGSWIDRHQFDHLKGVKEMYIFHRMEKRDIIYLSAGDAVYLKKSFLLSAFGTVFTYGLIIANFK